MIRPADRQSVPELKRLWKECFADEDAYIDAFYEAVYEDQDVLLEEEGGMLMGASFFLPGKIWAEQKGGSWQQTDGRWKDIRYVYALAVFPQYRGRGIAGRLLRSAYETYGAPLIAEPAEEGLVSGFYEPLGFAKSFYLEKNQIVLPAADKKPPYDLRAAQLQTELSVAGSSCTVVPAEAEDYCRIRDAAFLKRGYVRWPKRHIAFAIQEHRGSGGGAFVIKGNGREDILLYFIDGQTAVVTETSLSDQAAQAVLTQLAGQCEGAVMIRKVKTRGMQEYTQSLFLVGMSYGLEPAEGYLNLTLD